VSLSLTIKTAEDFKGKKIAISRFGSSSEVNLRLCLEKLGVKPELTQIIQVGGVSTRQTTLLPGQVDALNQGFLDGYISS